MNDIHAIIAAAKRWREVGGPSAKRRGRGSDEP